MKIIILTKGLETVVDDDIWEELNQYKWYASGLEGRPARRLREPLRRMIMMYHQILGVWPWELRMKGLVVDHINGDPLNNSRENLRIVTQAENMQNTLRSETRVGVALDCTHNKWKAYLDRPNQPRINIGTYKTRQEAELALNMVKAELGCENS